MIDVRNALIKEKVPGNKNPNKSVDIFEKIIGFNKKQRNYGIQTLTSKQKFQWHLHKQKQVIHLKMF